MLGDIIGHSQIVERLQKAATNPSHAYIITGEPGMGKLVLAQAFAKALQCEESEGDACKACLSCRIFESGNHPDVFYVKATKTKDIGVDDIRSQIVLPMSEKPFRYRYKIFIVNRALTVAAQNALLKTIEEPASFGIFILLTESTQLFLPTILSRCITLKLNPLSEEEMVKILGHTSKAAMTFARGNPGRALKLMESEDFEEMQKLAQIVTNSIYGMDTIDIFRLYNQFEKWKESIQTLLDMLFMCYREQLQTVGNLQGHISGISAVGEAKKHLYRNGNFQMTVELMLLKMSGAA
ncbi:MAG: hypothetical protein FWC91_12530 [Defluviitaleaceae bacterium]|nr:hypothetical protein [Defluviitaleaceae bacterium]